MLQINNLDDGKSEWNVNETHIIIPVINEAMNKNDKESDKILTNTITLNSLENEDHSVLSNTLEHSFVIGFNKSIFDTPNYKSDLVIIQNSDLRLLSCNNDLKNPVAYTLSYIDQNKSESLWQNSVSKEKNGLNDKAILEVKDVLNYVESVHELEKTELQINLSNVDSEIASQVAQTNNGIVTGENESANTKKSSYFVEVSNDESEPILHSLNGSSSNEEIKLESNKKLYECKSQANSSFENAVKEGTLNVTKEVMECDELMSVDLANCIKFEINEKNKISSHAYKETKNENDALLGVSDCFPEQSLPLKKKAKMKRTLVSSSFENQRSVFLCNETPNHQKNIKSSGKKTKHFLTTIKTHEEEKMTLSKLLIKKTRKLTTATAKTRTKHCKKMLYDSLMQKVKNKTNSFVSHTKEENEITKVDKWDIDKFKTIYDLVEHLRKSHLISFAVSETLNSGLREIKIDILKEMNSKKNKDFLLKSSNYSPQLKAFALVLYFKQPAAFNYLSQVFKVGWPSLKVIKEWKCQINNTQKPNIVSRANSEGGKL